MKRRQNAFQTPSFLASVNSQLNGGAGGVLPMPGRRDRIGRGDGMLCP